MSGSHGTRTVEVFVAACTGSARLSGAIGLPLVHIDVAHDAVRALGPLNATEHASGVRVPNLFQPIIDESGWSDWHLFPYAPGSWRRGMGARPDGVHVAAGRIRVSLPARVTFAEFRDKMRSALRHLRLHEVTSCMLYMAMRSDAGLEYHVEPRYTWNQRDRSFRGTRVDDLYVFDPAERPWSLFWAVVAARAAATQGAPV